MIIGGVAVISHGVRRLTTDIDAVVRGDSITARQLVRRLARHAIRPRIEDAATFADRNLVLLLRHEPTGVDLDVSLGWSTLEHEALEARTEAAFGRVKTYMATPADLVVFKAVAARPRPRGSRGLPDSEIAITPGRGRGRRFSTTWSILHDRT